MSGFARGATQAVRLACRLAPALLAEMPVLARVARDFPNVSFLTVVTSIGTNPGPDPGAFMADNGITMPTAIDDAGGTLAKASGIRGFPTLYFVGSDGAVARMTEGEIDEDALRRMIGSMT